jgi:hypothetical protein
MEEIQIPSPLLWVQGSQITFPESWKGKRMKGTKERATRKSVFKLMVPGPH